ncbi:MAG: hypothetical protein J6X02_04135 [Bacilli bacterium]|nr:hypothetical protein [Bacilli bacterium]
MKKLLTLLMAITLVLVPVKAFADEDVTVGYEIVEEDDDFYDDFEDDYEDYEDEEYYDDESDLIIYDESLDLSEDDAKPVVEKDEETITLSVCSVILLAVVPFVAGLLVGAGVMLLTCKNTKKVEEKKDNKENKRNDK